MYSDDQVMTRESGVKLFKDNWYCIVDVEAAPYAELKDKISSILRNTEGVENLETLDTLHNSLDSKNLNEVRLNAIKIFNEVPEVKTLIYDCVSKYLSEIVGNDLVVQRKVNLSLQLPGDDSSVLPIHSDAWCGNSPFEVVVWIPFCEVFKTKSMFFLDKERTIEYTNKIKSDKCFNASNILKEESESLIWPHLKEGQALIFSHSLLHGNVVNEEEETRVSLNLRFKSPFTPYGEKGIENFFEVFRLTPATQIGLDLHDQ